MDPLKKIKDSLSIAVEQKKRAEDFAKNVGPAILDILRPAIEDMGNRAQITKEDMIDAVKSITVEAPTVSVPEAKVTVEIPEIKVPTPEVTVNVPEIKIPTINVPEPKVTVNIPDFPKIPEFPKVEIPDTMNVVGAVSLLGIDNKSPLPVRLIDLQGRPYESVGNQSVGGGRGDYFTIKDIQTSSGASLIDQVEGALKVTGNFSVTSSASSTYAQLVDSDGNAYTSTNPLQIAGSISTTPGATFYASDAVGSVNVIQSITLDVKQLSGSIDSVYITGAGATIGVVTINPDGNPVYGGSSSGGGLTDTELRASSVPVSQVSGNIDSVNVVSTVGLTDTQLRASTVDVKQVSGSSDSVNVLSMPAVTVTGITNTIASNLVDSSGVAYSGSNPLTVQGTVAVSGITNTVGANIVDSSGVAYSTSNPFPIDDAGGSLTIDGSVSVSDIFGSVGTNVVNPDGRLKVELPTGSSGLTDTELRASHLDVQQLSGAIDSVYVTGIFGSSMSTSDVLNGDNRIRVSVETGGSGLTDSELRASHLDVQQVSGATDSVNIVSSVALTVTDITNSIAAALVDSSGVAYSGSNPVPVTFSAAGFQNVAMYDAQQSSITSHFDPTGDFRGLDNTNLRTVNYESVLNSSTTTLGISGVFTGLAEDIKDYSVITLSVFADQASATDGLSIQQSSNGTNWDIVKTFTVSASQGKLISVQAAARYFRVVYTNGGVAQGAFRMMPIFKQGNQKGSSQRTSDAATNEEDLEQVWSYNSGFNGTTWDRIGVNVGAATTAQRVVHASDAVASTNIVAQEVTLNIKQLSGSVDSVVVNSGTITTVTTLTGITQSAALFKSRQANPTAIANDWVAPAADDLGRIVTRPVQVRDLIKTAYVALANGTETTLLATTAGTFNDLIMITATNNSTAATQLDIRDATGGNIVHTMYLPASTGPVGFAPAVPYPQGNQGNNWTVDMPDITGTTVYITALFTNEV